MIFPSTFSIVACDLIEKSWGVAVASKFPAVGAVVPWAQAEIGAVATQSFANTSYGPYGLELLKSGLPAESVLNQLLANDPDREHRQVGIVDFNGASATFTGKECHAWAGGISGPGYSIQGNILVSDQVISVMQITFMETKGALPARLYAALLAGDEAGGDRRGRQSAALYVTKPKGGYGGFNDRWVDYRVDDDPDPVKQLGALLDMHQLYFGKSPEAEHVQLSGKSLMQLQEMLVKTGYYSGPIHGNFDTATVRALNAFIGNENFEDRYNDKAGWIDQPVFEYILKKFGK